MELDRRAFLGRGIATTVALSLGAVPPAKAGEHAATVTPEGAAMALLIGAADPARRRAADQDALPYQFDAWVAGNTEANREHALTTMREVINLFHSFDRAVEPDDVAANVGRLLRSAAPATGLLQNALALGDAVQGHDRETVVRPADWERGR
jgi:hypothetical protein